MKRNQQSITYTFVSRDAGEGARKALQTAIVEKLLRLYQEKPLTANLNPIIPTAGCAGERGSR